MQTSLRWAGLDPQLWRFFQSSFNFSLIFSNDSFWRIMLDKCFILQTFRVTNNFRVTVNFRVRVRIALETSKWRVRLSRTRPTVNGKKICIVVVIIIVVVVLVVFLVVVVMVLFVYNAILYIYSSYLFQYKTDLPSDLVRQPNPVSPRYPNASGVYI